MEKNKIDYSELEKERIITVADLIREIIRRIWIVIVLAVVFALILGGYKYYRDTQSAKQKASSAAVVTADSSLTDEEVNDVKNVLYIKDNINDLQTYVDNSVLMQVDAENENRVILQYRLEVSEGDTARDYQGDVLSSYQSYINNGALAADLTENGYDLDAPYLQELLVVEDVFGSTSTASAENSEEQGEVTPVTTSFSLMITHVDQESVEELADLIEEQLNTYGDTLTDLIGSHELTLINRSYLRMVDTNLRTYKYDRINNILTMQSKAEEMESDLSSAQQELLNQYETVGVSTGTSQAADDVQEADTNTTSQSVKVHISRRYVGAGIIIGIVLAFIYIIVAYILRGSLNTANDIRYLYDLRVLGEIKLSGNKTLRKRWIHLSEEEQMEVLVANLKSICQEEGIEKILINGSSGLKEDQTLAEKLEEEMKKYGVQIVYASDLPYSADAIGFLDDYKDVILLEKIRYSSYDMIQAEIRTCLEHESQIVGTIVFS